MRYFFHSNEPKVCFQPCRHHRKQVRKLSRKGMFVLLGSRDSVRGRAAAEQLQALGNEAEAVEREVTKSMSIRTVAYTGRNKSLSSWG